VETKTTKHSVYSLNYHIVLVTKYRHKVLVGEIETFVKTRLQELCQQYGWDLLASEVMPEHIHLFVSAEPKIAPLSIATTIKSILAVDVFPDVLPRLKSKYFWGSGLFSRGCYYGSAGTVSSETIRRYIEEQKEQ